MEIKKYLAELLGTFFLVATVIASWLVTIPAGAAFTILFYILLRIIFSV